MIDTIKRKICVTTIHSYAIENGRDSPTVKGLDPITVYGKVSEKEARKIVREKYSEESKIHLAQIDTNEMHLEITIEDFIRYAKPIQSK